jgi:hypothetical protein
MQQKKLQQMSYTFRPSNSWPRNDGAVFFLNGGLTHWSGQALFAFFVPSFSRTLQEKVDPQLFLFV